MLMLASINGHTGVVEVLLKDFRVQLDLQDHVSAL